MAASSEELIRAVKLALKQQGKTYADVGKMLNLSEASIKRLFSNQSLSIERLGRILDILNLDLSELLSLAQSKRVLRDSLTWKQEAEIVGNPALLIITISIISHWTFEDLMTSSVWQETEIIQALSTLDRLGVITLLPANRIRLLLSPSFRWQPGGPVQQFFQRHVLPEFFSSRFEKDNETLLVGNFSLSKASVDRCQTSLDRLVKELESLQQEDALRPFDQRNGHTLVMGLRPWRFSSLLPKGKEKPG